MRFLRPHIGSRITRRAALTVIPLVSPKRIKCDSNLKRLLDSTVRNTIRCGPHWAVTCWSPTSPNTAGLTSRSGLPFGSVLSRPAVASMLRRPRFSPGAASVRRSSIRQTEKPTTYRGDSPARVGCAVVHTLPSSENCKYGEGCDVAVLRLLWSVSDR